MGKKQTSDAAKILRNRYSKDRKASYDIANLVFGARRDAGLTQKELAGWAGTTQSVISRLENADYHGHSLSLLARIAKATGRNLKVEMVKDSASADN